MERRSYLSALATSFAIGTAGCAGEGGIGTETANLGDVIDESREIPYDDLKRNSDRYVSEFVHFPAGEITQVLGDEDEGFQFRVYVNQGEYRWEDDILTRWNGERYLEDDIIEIWGRFNGLVTYETVLGAERTIPDVRAREIELHDDGQGQDESQPPQTSDENPSQSDESTSKETSNVPEPDPLSFSGSGQTVIDDVEIIGGLTVIEGQHDGARNFVIKLVPPEGNDNELFINEIGRYEGAVADLIDADTYQIDVIADGSWDLTVRQPRPSSGESLPQSLSSEGSVVEGPLSFEGNHTATGSHSGERNFQVIIFSPTGDYGEVVFNEIGEFDGETTFRQTGIGFVDIRADGDWKIELE